MDYNYGGSGSYSGSSYDSTSHYSSSSHDYNHCLPGLSDLSSANPYLGDGLASGASTGTNQFMQDASTGVHPERS